VNELQHTGRRPFDDVISQLEEKVLIDDAERLRQLAVFDRRAA